MNKFVKLSNGCIIFVTKCNEVDKMYHGVNLASPQLKQINVSFSSVNTSWHVDQEEAETMLKKSMSDINTVYSSHPETVLQKRLKRIIDEMAKHGMQIPKPSWSKSTRYLFWSSAHSYIVVARPLEILDTQIHFQWTDQGQYRDGHISKTDMLAFVDKDGAVALSGRDETFALLNTTLFNDIVRQKCIDLKK